MKRLAVAFAVLSLGAVAHWQMLSAARAVPSVSVLELVAFPRQFGDWIAVDEAPLAPEVVRQLGASQTLSRRYLHAPSGMLAEIFLGYFASQTPLLLAEQSPHLPTVCLPAAGWTIVDRRVAGNANVLHISSGRERRDVLFWEQTATHAFANPLWSRWYGPLDQWRTGRNDLMIVRVLLPENTPGQLDLQQSIEKAVKKLFSSPFTQGSNPV